MLMQSLLITSLGVFIAGKMVAEQRRGITQSYFYSVWEFKLKKNGVLPDLTERIFVLKQA